MNRFAFYLLGAFIAALLLSSALFVVDQRQFAVVYEFGKVKSVVRGPGLNLKLPSPLQTVTFLDRRIQTLDGVSGSPLQTAEKKTLVVDWLVKWRIVDPLRFIRSLGADASVVDSRLGPIVQSAFGDELAKLTVDDVLSSQREPMMQDVVSRVKRDTTAFGIDVMDVRLKRVDFSAATIDTVYRRMESERTRAAKQLRALGEEEGNDIRAEADRQRDVMVAEAYRDAQKTMGDGDAKAAAIYGAAYGQDPQFAKFFRNLQAYVATFQGKSDIVVVDPGTSEFFKAMKGSAVEAAPTTKR